MDFAVNWQNELCVAKNGVVVTEFPQASLVGLKVLQEGGNAVDASVATAATLNVIGLGRSGLGGDAFILVYDGKSKQVTGINGSGRAPYAASVDYYKKQGRTHMAEDGIHSASVPGAVDAYVEVLERFGTMPLKELLQPAIEFAEEGLLMKAGDRKSLAADGKLRKFPNTAKVFCKDEVLSKPREDGKPFIKVKSLKRSSPVPKQMADCLRCTILKITHRTFMNRFKQIIEGIPSTKRLYPHKVTLFLKN